MNNLSIKTIGKPEKWLVQAAAEIGLDYSSLVHEVTNHFKTHVIKRHGDPAKHGAATVKEADFDQIPGIVKNPDIAIIGAVRHGGLYNVYVKVEAGITCLYSC